MVTQTILPLEKKMDSSKIVKYLLDELQDSAENEIKPCVEYGHKQGRKNFGVPRLVLSYVDYLGVLYHGYDGNQTKTNRRRLSDPKYAKNFLKDVFVSICSHN